MTITTLGILASFNKKIQKLPKTFELGMFLYLFSVLSSLRNSIFTALEESAHNMLVYPVYNDYRYHYTFGDLQGIQGEW